jgi:hypothetical protein
MVCHQCGEKIISDKFYDDWFWGKETDGEEIHVFFHLECWRKYSIKLESPNKI